MKQVEREKEDVHTVEYKTWQECHMSDLKNTVNQKFCFILHIMLYMELNHICNFNKHFQMLFK